MTDQLPIVGTTAPAANARPGERMVGLVDGTEVGSWSEAWRNECEARALLAMPLEARRCALYGEWVDVMTPGKPRTQERKRGIEQKRGAECVKRLEVTMTAIWEARKAARAA